MGKAGSLISSLVTWGRNDGWHSDEKTHVVTPNSQDKNDDDFENKKNVQ